MMLPLPAHRYVESVAPASLIALRNQTSWLRRIVPPVFQSHSKASVPTYYYYWKASVPLTPQTNTAAAAQRRGKTKEKPVGGASINCQHHRVQCQSGYLDRYGLDSYDRYSYGTIECNAEAAAEADLLYAGEAQCINDAAYSTPIHHHHSYRPYGYGLRPTAIGRRYGLAYEGWPLRYVWLLGGTSAAVQLLVSRSCA